MSRFLVVLLMGLPTTTTTPSNYDTRKNWDSCISFMPVDQGSCNGCVAASLSSIMGIRACIRDGRNIRFSAQQIWDCYGGSCEHGVNMDNFIFAMLYSQRSENMLLVSSNYTSILPSNISDCKTTESREKIESISSYRETWLDLLDSGQKMKNEIFDNGPVISILYLTSSEMNLFSNWADLSETKVLDKLPLTTESRDHIHAVSVIGWGNRTSDGTFYWIILNSFGAKWGNKGVGNIPRGFGSLEHEWYSVVSTPVPCSSDCIVTNANKNLTKIPTVSAIDDDMFLSPKNMMTMQERGNVKYDGLILGGIILMMCVLSIIICSIHLQKRKEEQTLTYW
jgi:hypothetical protein